MKTITDRHGKPHKLITKRIDDLGLYNAVINIGELYNSIHHSISAENADAFLEVLKRLETEAGIIKCDELVASFVIEQGYNFDD